jgi:poly [ADP-ribose] polymerase 2/3/4
MCEPTFLVKVDAGANNNKFYRMIPNGNTFTAQWGRVGYEESAQSMDYPISLWDKKRDEKLRKGYADQTRLVARVAKVGVESVYADIANPSIRDIVNRLQSMAKQAISDNYTISSNKVTQTMIDEAQNLISKLSDKLSVNDFNSYLVDLFMTIPRKMAKVADNLARSQRDFGRILQGEQDLLDVMRGQVVQDKIIGDADTKDDSVEIKQTILESLGLDILEVSKTDVDVIKNHLNEIRDKFSTAWKVVNRKTQSNFNKFVSENNISNKKLLWHGSKNENWWSILNSGLVLRPNAAITGKMFGMGIYFAPSAHKSFGYTSYNGSYWAGGRSNIAYMSLFDVAYGKPLDVYSFDGHYGSLTYEGLQRISKGATCLHAHAGSMLRKDEIVVYQENQITVKYLVELK